MQYLGDFAEDATVYIPFNTFSSDDPQASVTITNLVDADIKVHKDGSATEIVTDGATIAIDFDTVTGNHLIIVDTSAHADYSTGSDYLVRIEGTTVDGGTINAFVGSFSIENRYMRGTDSAATAASLATAQTDLDTITGADGVTLATAQPSITFQPVTITAGDAVDNITLAGTGSADGISFTRSGSGDPFDAAIMAQLNAEMDTAISDASLATAAALATADANIDAILADTGTDGVVLSAAQMNKIADHVLRRAFATAAASSDGDTKDFRSLLGAVAKLVNKVAISGSTLSIYEDDDTTALGSQTLTTDAAADPITGADTV